MRKIYLSPKPLRRHYNSEELDHSIFEASSKNIFNNPGGIYYHSAVLNAVYSLVKKDHPQAAKLILDYSKGLEDER